MGEWKFLSETIQGNTKHKAPTCPAVTEPIVQGQPRIGQRPQRARGQQSSQRTAKSRYLKESAQHNYADKLDKKIKDTAEGATKAKREQVRTWASCVKAVRGKERVKDAADALHIWKRTECKDKRRN